MERALEAKTWRLSAQDPLLEDSGLQELTEGNQGCGWARPEHRRVAGRAVLASHRINPPNNLVRQLGESGTVTRTEGLSRNTWAWQLLQNQQEGNFLVPQSP